jgi:hypothetical protein
MFLQQNPSQGGGLLLNPLFGRIARIVVQKNDEDLKGWHKMLVVQTLKPQVALYGEFFSGGEYSTLMKSLSQATFVWICLRHG